MFTGILNWHEVPRCGNTLTTSFNLVVWRFEDRSFQVQNGIEEIKEHSCVLRAFYGGRWEKTIGKFFDQQWWLCPVGVRASKKIWKKFVICLKRLICICLFIDILIVRILQLISQLIIDLLTLLNIKPQTQNFTGYPNL